MTLDLFPATALDIPINDGELTLFDQVLPPSKSLSVMEHLQAEIDWQTEELVIFGRQMRMPRQTAWYGDAAYTYSGLRHEPRAWPPLLAELRRRVEQTTKARFNTVLLNHYRDGSDGMGWHSDDEPELGDNPVIASLNFGATRRFRFRKKKNTSQTLSLDLKDASLLLMSGAIQHHWQHALPKTKKRVGPRINLTFRNIVD